MYFAAPQDFSQNSQKITNSLKSQTETTIGKSIETISSKAAGAISGDSNLLIAIGPEALKEVLQGSGDSPVVSVLVSKRSFDLIIGETSPRKRSVSAIYSDPDPAKQIALSKVLFGVQAKGVVIKSPSSEPYLAGFNEAAQAYNVGLSVVDISSIDSSEDFIKLTRANQILFLIKDSHLFDKVPLEKVMLSSYDINKQGVIGYSKGIVTKGGGAATTYSSLADIAESIARQSDLVDKGKPLALPDFTQTFQISLNKYVLRSLDAERIDEKTAYKRVESLIREGIK